MVVRNASVRAKLRCIIDDIFSISSFILFLRKNIPYKHVAREHFDNAKIGLFKKYWSNIGKEKTEVKGRRKRRRGRDRGRKIRRRRYMI